MALSRSLAYLTTGVLLNLVSQLLVSTKDFADKSTQILPWVKYLATIVPPALQRLKDRAGGAAPPPITQQQRTWLTAIGLLDLVAYTLFSLAYFSCGAALSNLLLAACGQVLTALSTVLLLKQRLTPGQWLGISLIVAGLAMRAAPSGGGSGSGSGSSEGVALTKEQWVGVTMILGAACLYTAVGLLYERLTKGVAKPPPHTEVMWHTSKLGFLISSAYQLLYTLPRFKELVTDKMEFNQVTPSQLFPLLLAFGAMFNLHMLAQSGVFKSDGAIGVGVVNSVRGAALTVVTSALFCSPERPWLCLSVQSGLSAAVTTLGGMLWVLSDPKAWRRPAGAAAAAAQKDKTS